MFGHWFDTDSTDAERSLSNALPRITFKVVEAIRHQPIIDAFFRFEIQYGVPPSPPGLHVVVGRDQCQAVACAGVKGNCVSLL